VMGGTQFNGLALVRELVRTGHDVSICNRGKTAAELPRSVSRLTADRTDPGQLRAALAGRDWDCVFDISAYRPEDARLMSELLRGRTGHYVFASSTVIYAPTDLLPITEDHPLDTSERQNDYGRNKILCEEILLREHRERGFPATVAAFSMVFGPHNIIPDREQRMFVRLARGRPLRRHVRARGGRRTGEAVPARRVDGRPLRGADVALGSALAGEHRHPSGGIRRPLCGAVRRAAHPPAARAEPAPLEPQRLLFHRTPAPRRRLGA